MTMMMMMLRIMMRMVNGSSRWPFSTAFKDCTLMAPRTLFLSLFLPPTASRSSLHCSSLTLSPSPRSHYFGIVFVTASYDAIIDLSKKQNTLCQKKTKKLARRSRKISKAKYRHSHTLTQRHTGDSSGQRSAANLVTRIDVH